MLTLKLVFVYTMHHALCALPSDESKGPNIGINLEDNTSVSILQ